MTTPAMETIEKWLFANHKPYCVAVKRGRATGKSCLCDEARAALSHLKNERHLLNETYQALVEAARDALAQLDRAGYTRFKKVEALRAALQAIEEGGK